MSEPRTAAGRSLLADHMIDGTNHEACPGAIGSCDVVDAILAIEAEARAAGVAEEHERAIDACAAIVIADSKRVRAAALDEVRAAMEACPRTGYAAVYGTPNSGWAIPEQAVLAAIDALRERDGE